MRGWEEMGGLVIQMDRFETNRYPRYIRTSHASRTSLSNPSNIRDPTLNHILPIIFPTSLSYFQPNLADVCNDRAQAKKTIVLMERK